MFPQLLGIEANLKADLERLDYKQGEIVVGDGVATFNVNDDFYFLDPSDAQIVLTEFWQNPAGPAPLGMIFPAEMTPFQRQNWGIIITFDNIGYVSDEDANDYDSNKLLNKMRRDIAEESKLRVAEGHSAVRLMGWAEPPHYDQPSRKLYWGQMLYYGDLQEHGVDITRSMNLNYFIHALGRKGVLNMIFVAPSGALDQIKTAVPAVLEMSTFNAGNKYSDFDPSLDKVAAIGIGGLIVGKVIAKNWLLLGLLVIFKKFWIVLIPLLVWGWKKLSDKSKHNVS